jgi:TolB-like protein
MNPGHRISCVITPFCALALMLLPSFLFAQAPEKTGKSSKLNIAVTELEGRGLGAGEASTLTDALASHLSNTGAFRVMERGKMDLILKEQGFQQSGACTDEACIVEMGQLLGVDHMVTGSIGKVGKTFSVNVRMISIATSEIVRTVSKNYKGEIDGVLTDVMPAIAEQFAGLKADAPVAQAATPAAVPAPAPSPQPQPAPEKKTEEVKSQSSGGGHTALWVLGGAAVAGGAVAAFLILNKGSDSSPNTTPPAGAVEVTW